MTAQKPQTAQRSGTAELWARYWAAYGGWKELFVSSYFVAAAAATLLMAGSWTVRGWWDTVISVLPNVLGFTLGGYAILLSFGDEKFRAMLAATKTESLDHGLPLQASPYRQLSASFLHFIVVQTLALVTALIAKGLDPFDRFIRTHVGDTALLILRWGGLLASLLGYLLFVYALFAALAASFYVFRLSTWFELFASNTTPTPPACQPPTVAETAAEK